MPVEMQIAIKELDAFRRGLRKIDSNLSKQLGQINKRAGEKVVREAQSRYQQQYTVRSGGALNTMRASAAASRAQIVIGRANNLYVLGQEFGSNRYPQFAPWSGPAPGGRGSRGRFFYPAVREETSNIMEDYLKELDNLAREAFPRG